MAFLVARPLPKAQSTQLALQDASLTAHIAPVLQVNILNHSILCDRLLDDSSDIMIITSTYAVDWLTQQALTHSLGHYKIVCIGQSTADALMMSIDNSLQKAQLKNALVLPEKENSEGVLALPLMQDLAGKRIIILKGEGGRNIIYTVAKSRGALVSELCVYRRDITQDHAFNFNLDAIECIIVTSVDIAKACFEVFDPHFLQNIHWMVASQRIKDYAISCGVAAVSLSNGASQSAITQCALNLVHTGVVNDRQA